VQITTISSARTNLFTIAQETIESHEPVIMTSKHGNVVLLSEEDFKAMQETLYLQSIPNVVADVHKGREEPKNKLAVRKDLPWKK
jgi:antitoxin YefM